MKIKDMKVWKEDLDLLKPYAIAYKTIDSVESVFVELTLENGITGIGACNPSESVVGESTIDSLNILVNHDFDWLLDTDIRHFHDLADKTHQNFLKYPGAMAALDIALHDAFTKFLGIPLIELYGRRIESMPTSVTIGIMDVEETLAEAKEYLDQGFKSLKVKLGKSVEMDIERIVKIREQLGNEFLIRVDANQGYDTAHTIKFYETTKDCKLELIEQPMPVNEYEKMRELPAEIKDNIAADENLIGPEDALKMVYPEPACGIFNIKLMKCGGISQSKKIADIASYHHNTLMWGCNDESIVSIAAALHAAFSCSHTKFIDLDGSFDLAKDLVTGGFVLEDGYMKLTDKPGLGVERAG